MPAPYSPYLFILLLAICAAAFALVPLGLAWLWARKYSPKKENAIKNATYECGLESKGDAWIQFKSEYYLYAIISQIRLHLTYQGSVTRAFGLHYYIV